MDKTNFTDFIKQSDNDKKATKSKTTLAPDPNEEEIEANQNAFELC